MITDKEQNDFRALHVCVFVQSYGLKPVFIHYLLFIQQIVAKVLIEQLTWHSP